jgi:hypothetical protein
MLRLRWLGRQAGGSSTATCSMGEAVNDGHQHEGHKEHLQQIRSVAIHGSRSPRQGLQAKVREFNPAAFIAAAPAGWSWHREGGG